MKQLYSIGIIGNYTVGGKNGKENIEGLKTIQLSNIVVCLLHSYLA